MRNGLTDSVKAAAAGQMIRTAHFFRAVFTNSVTGEDEEYLMTDYHRSVEWNGLVWNAMGHALGFSGLEEDTDSLVSRVSVSLSGIDSAYIALLLQYKYIDRELEIWRSFFLLPGDIVSVWDDSISWDDQAVLADTQDTDVLLADPVKIFSGRMDEPVIREDPAGSEVVVSLTAASHFVDFLRRPGRHTNHDEQQAFFPGDRGFEFVGNLDKNLTWGAK